MNPLLIAQLARKYWWAGAIAAALVIAGVQTLRANAASDDLVALRRDYRDLQVQRKTVADLHDAKIKQLTAEHQTATKEKDDAWKLKNEALQLDVATRTAAVGGLRQQLTAATANRGRGGQVDQPTCQRDADRLESLGALAGESLGLLEEGRSLVRQRDIEVEDLLTQIAIDRQACRAGI